MNIWPFNKSEINPKEFALLKQILIDECGASEYQLEGLDHYLNSIKNINHIEWRFQGDLGFGGKLRNHPVTENYYVTCYSEDETPKRKIMIANANTRLEKIKC